MRRGDARQRIDAVVTQWLTTLERPRGRKLDEDQDGQGRLHQSP
ncbi:hypothetical protein [Streptomyces lydicus]|nr:hypothetical protein [Streptomyces lydicus]MCZ1008217.1 hypothetical protein [Streptomyces lydicus]